MRSQVMSLFLRRGGVGLPNKWKPHASSHDRNARVAAVLEPVFAIELQKHNLIFAKHARHGLGMFRRFLGCSRTPPPLDRYSGGLLLRT